MSIIYNNLNLFLSLVAATVMIFLASAVYFHNRKGITSKLFIIHTIIGILWIGTNYYSIILISPLVLWVIRGVIALAVMYVFLFYLFVRNFPEDRLIMHRIEFALTLLLMGAMIAFAYTPYVFKSVLIFPRVVPIIGVLMPLFSLFLITIFLIAFILVIKKTFQSEGLLRKQWLSLGGGMVIAYILLFSLVFLRTIISNDPTFVPYSPLFVMPIFIGAAYAILRHKLFDIKVAGAEILTFMVATISIIQVLLAESSVTRVLSIITALFLVGTGILFIRSIIREVQQREKLEILSKELAAANEKLQLADRMKSQFLSFASHQVKSPMTVVKDYAELIRDESFGAVPDKVKETAEKIKTAANRLLELVGNLLDLRKLEEGKIEYRFANFDIVAMIKQIVEEQSIIAKTKNLELTFETDIDKQEISGDAEKIRQVIQNLIDNSIKYTEKGWIRVQIKNEIPASPAGRPACAGRSKIKIEVSDSGLGIPADVLPTLFEQFNRGGDEAKKIQGTGLGLYIAKQFVEAHHGTIAAASEGSGKGSRFTVELRASY